MTYWMSDNRRGLETTGLTGRKYKLWATKALRAHAAERGKEGAVALFVRELGRKRFEFVGGFADFGAASRAVEKLETVH